MVTERNYAIWWLKKYSGSDFQRVGTGTETARVPALVLTLETDNKWKPDERSSVGLGAKESMENR